MSAYVLGLDLSLTQTGVATVAENGGIDTRVEKSPAAGDGPRARWHRLCGIADRVCPSIDPYADRPALVVIEGPSYGQRQQAGVHDRSGLWWLVVGRVLDAGVPLAVVAPRTRAKWATGKGNAGKSEVAVGAARLFPDVNARYDDEWDALILAAIGAQHLGWGVPRRAYHAACQAAVEWPMEAAA